MPRLVHRSLVTLVVLGALAVPATSQTVISARSGVIHFFEGDVFRENEPLDSQPGKFQMLERGQELRTAQGNAELLLTPGVFLRMGENSAIRMIANELADTRVELLAGSIVLDAGEQTPDTSVKVLCKSWTVHFRERGAYRLDAEPPRLWVEEGKAEVSAGDANSPVNVPQGTELPLAAVLVPEVGSPPAADQLSGWSEGRIQSIAADDAIAAQISDDPTRAGLLDMGQSMDPGQGILTYFPFLGLPAVDIGIYGGGVSGSLASGLSRSYGSLALAQPGFHSSYLPGYTYQSPLLRLLVNRYRAFSSPQFRIGVSPRVGMPLPVVPGIHVPVTHPGSAVVHPAVHGGRR